MDCIINPITGRAVKINSPAGRRAIKYSDKNDIPKTHDCVINPKTGRAVKKDSPIGRRIMKQDKTQSPLPVKQAPPAKQAPPPVKKASSPPKQAPPPVKKASSPPKQAPPPVKKASSQDDEDIRIEKNIALQKKSAAIATAKNYKIIDAYLNKYYAERGITSQSEKDKIKKGFMKGLDFDVYTRGIYDERGEANWPLKDRHLIGELATYLMYLKDIAENPKKQVKEIHYFDPRPLDPNEVDMFPPPAKGFYDMTKEERIKARKRK